MTSPSEPNSAVVHFYRAIVMHADVWRERLDATTNWAVVITIGIISFAFSRPETPHFVLLFLVASSSLFLIMESRRYQTYDLWRRRIRSLNQYVIAPQLSPVETPSEDDIQRGRLALAHDLGRAVPHLRFIDAVGYRLRRNYGYIYLFTVSSWLLKMYLHPDQAHSFSDFVQRAQIADFSGSLVLTVVSISSLIVLFLALRAPSEQMLSWRRLPSPLSRLKDGALFRDDLADDQRARPFERPGPLGPKPMEEFFPLEEFNEALSSDSSEEGEDKASDESHDRDSDSDDDDNDSSKSD